MVKYGALHEAGRCKTSTMVFSVSIKNFNMLKKFIELKVAFTLHSAEWHQVYKQIYSNNINEQLMGYEMLLAWKAR